MSPTRALVLGVSFASLSAHAMADLRPYKPSAEELKAAYARADQLRSKWQGKIFNATIEPTWIDDYHFWFRSEIRGDRKFVIVDALLGSQKPAFDHARLATGLGDATKTKVNANRLPIDRLKFADDMKSVSFSSNATRWKADLTTYTVTLTSAETSEPDARLNERRRGRRSREGDSPDGKWNAAIQGGKIVVKAHEGDAVAYTTNGNAYEQLFWSPDAKHLVGIRVIPGDRKPVYLIQSSPAGGGRAVLKTRPYDLPGDKLDLNEVWQIDLQAKTETKVAADPIEIDFEVSVHWKGDGATFTYEKTDRGNTRFRIFEVEAKTGQVSTLVDHQPKTFIDQTTKWLQYLKNDDILWRSEKDGWNRLYYIHRQTHEVTPITTGDWVVRGVSRVDEAEQQIVFEASGVHSGEDPYFNHVFKVKFDGTGLTELTPSVGTHTAQFSPSRKYLIDTYSTITTPPVHELRDADSGKLICQIGRADTKDLEHAGWRAPEPFVAKGRDGQTDIYGVVYRPTNFDPNRKYPVIENIYAGPQDSFVPKAFAGYNYMQSVAELGFIVVQCDGMGTRNRSKAFHDVCWKNLADAGFPDRIAWMKSLAAKYPQFDVSRVGIFGTSAGGQNSTGAMLFHPEFYKVAVSSCGCHDNRMDKYWWNEQWMGVVGPHYDEQSNITNAYKLKGRLLLMVGELDTNVPPESTYRLVDALIKAGKDFEFVMLPGLDHTAGGTFGERKRRDFFVKNLLGVEPPERNSVVVR